MENSLGNWAVIDIETSGIDPHTDSIIDIGYLQFNNTTLIPMRGSKKEMMKSLLDGKILILASDQNAGDRGTKVLFFGKETSVPKGAAYFYHKTNCPIVVGFCILKRDYSYEFKLRPFDILNENDIKSLCINVNTKYSLLLEEEIKKYPEQYFWFHKKWDKKIYKYDL